VTANTATLKASATVRSWGFRGAQARRFTAVEAVTLLGGTPEQKLDARRLAQAWCVKMAVDFVILRSVCVALRLPTGDGA
jgi:hypothetical protein